MEFKKFKELSAEPTAYHKEFKTIAQSCSFVLALLLLPLSPFTSSAQGVVFSHGGGFYADTFSLSMHIDFLPHSIDTLMHSHINAFSIHYTLNGAEPTECDAEYTTPLPMTPALYSPSNLYRVQDVPDDRWFAPDEVQRIIVVRAAVFDSTGERRSVVTTHAYLIDSLLGRHITLPVVSICTDSLSLFDHDTGLFVPGYCFDPLNPYGSGNYFQRGRHWERSAAFAYYDPAGGELEQDCGLRVHGNSQRMLVQKGLSLYARKEYGAGRFQYPFFGTTNTHAFKHSSIQAFKRLVLRPWSTSWTGAGVEDWLCQHLAEPLRCDHLATRPVVLFLNGEYWGVYFLEEKADEHYLEEHYRVPHHEVDLIACWGQETENGNATRWNTFYRWLQQADLSRDDDYNHLASQVDIDALIDYMLLQLLVLNDDWPVNNVRSWATTDRPWRWIFFDGDGTLVPFPGAASVLDHMTFNMQRKSTRTSLESTLLFRRLLANRQFLERTMRRLKEIVDSHFSYETTAPLLHGIVEDLRSEVPYQRDRFAKPLSIASWEAAVGGIDDFLRIEPQDIVEEYARYFGLGYPDGGGFLIVDGEIHLDAPTTESRDFIIYDICGRKVSELNIQPSSFNIQLPSLPRGIYFVQQLHDGTVQKWIIE